MGLRFTEMAEFSHGTSFQQVEPLRWLKYRFLVANLSHSIFCCDDSLFEDGLPCNRRPRDSCRHVEIDFREFLQRIVIEAQDVITKPDCSHLLQAYTVASVPLILVGISDRSTRPSSISCITTFARTSLESLRSGKSM